MSKSCKNKILAEKSEGNKEEINGIESLLTSQSQSYAPFEVAYTEHIELDVELFDSKEKTRLGRPWITLLIDKFTGRSLGYHLSLNAPSYLSNMMVVRECVKRYSRLPNTVVIDGGKEFLNHDFQVLMEKYSIVIKIAAHFKKRRMINPKNRFFNNISDRIRRLPVTIKFPFLTIEELNEKLYLFFEVSEQVDQFPKCMETKARLIEYDENFEIMTCPSPPKKQATIIQNKGVKINNIYYWSTEFDNMGEKMVPVKYDPQDKSIAYAYLNNSWIKLTSM